MSLNNKKEMNQDNRQGMHEEGEEEYVELIQEIRVLFRRIKYLFFLLPRYIAIWILSTTSLFVYDEYEVHEEKDENNDDHNDDDNDDDNADNDDDKYYRSKE